MPATRTSKTTTISLPPRLYRQAVRLARARGMTRSELFRDALRRYGRDEDEWQELASYGVRKAGQAGIRTEDDVERIVNEARR
jgi:metal-responsive CopG/Arc/MetJ family transcriptional regulator